MQKMVQEHEDSARIHAIFDQVAETGGTVESADAIVRVKPVLVDEECDRVFDHAG